MTAGLSFRAAPSEESLFSPDSLMLTQEGLGAMVDVRTERIPPEINYTLSMGEYAAEICKTSGKEIEVPNGL